ncbi:type I restriction-modification system endonuclease [Aulosira sp. FACHB-615]|uniref:type I restriction-modification system endonuclease n=1 Tax=Aulosira sp. FACHB-615 TaxID=2692777 RepID=UPI001685EB2A|nr:type I restriction-modification system endonuclease [Aulosira sp. FACHB-615]MBD2492418.1 type I restriction-modification system endonuclease [Aulosira sp. FACHB-615]
MLVSPNFGFLAVHDPQLVRLGALAERYFTDDPNTCLIKLRQFGELLAQMIAANVGIYDDEERQIDLMRRLRDKGVLKGRAYDLFNELRLAGNDATHAFASDQRTALSNLKYARQLGIWFHRINTKNPDFHPGPFVPPQDGAVETLALKQELSQLRLELQASRTVAELAQITAQQEEQRRISAQELAKEAEAQKQAALNHLITLQATAQTQPAQAIQETIQRSQQAGNNIDLDERETRRLIDAQLRAAGWEVDSEQLTYSTGTRPQKGKMRAIAEWPTNDGRADYVLFVGLQVMAVVEAKRQSTDVYAAIDQAKRYSRGYKIKDNETLPGGTWGEYKVPFVFATNGREFLRQLQTKSGIWFCDVRRPENIRRPLTTWYKPEAFVDALNQDVDQAHERLAKEGFNYNLQLRDYQIKAIQAVETRLAQGFRELLLAMATGTGKTKTCLILVYRLLKTKRFRRVLFLVDRRALGEQTGNVFKETRVENLQTFADIFGIKELGEAAPESDTKVHIATVQAFVKRILYPGENATVPTADQYDCIVVDECHRGYLLDRELSDSEITFRDYDDYISKYRRVLDHFDAVKIGLTATPALQTTQIFGQPVYTYSYKEAVIDGYLIDCEPPIRIVTALSEDGMVWQPGAEMEYFDPITGRIDLVNAPDEVRIEVEHFNRQVVTEEFNRVICEYLAQNIDPSLPGKTLIFCVKDDHADIVVNLLKQALIKQYGSVEDDAVLKITGKADQPSQLIRRYKNEANPKIAVTVDLLTTGIDVPEICNLVFIRRVNSRILYEQMLGRATRRCDEIKKEVFYIYDAVNLYTALSPLSTMKPVAVNPKISFTQLVEELQTVNDSTATATIVEQLLAKLQRQQRRWGDRNRENIEAAAGMPISEMIDHLRQTNPQQLKEWFKQRAAIAQMLDERDGGRQPILISRHADELRRVERGYGNAQKPEDYLDSFSAYLRENINKIPALTVVTTRPRELTRAQLKELRLMLDLAGYSEKTLQVAWREMTNADIAASIIGFIRQATLGDALVPYEERVDKAMRKIMVSQNWTQPQRKWLERIGKQLKIETIMDRESLDQGEFKAQGGFVRLNKAFDGRLEDILVQINEALWQDVG